MVDIHLIKILQCYLYSLYFKDKKLLSCIRYFSFLELCLSKYNIVVRNESKKFIAFEYWNKDKFGN